MVIAAARFPPAESPQIMICLGSTPLFYIFLLFKQFILLLKNNLSLPKYLKLLTRSQLYACQQSSNPSGYAASGANL